MARAARFDYQKRNSYKYITFQLIVTDGVVYDAIFSTCVIY